MRNKILLIAIIILVIVLGCVGINKLRTKKDINSLEKIMDKGTFVLGLDDSFPPMGFRNEDNEVVGFDIDVAKEVCKRLGVELEIQPIFWSAKEQELNSGNIDCIWNGMSVTDERKEAMVLSDSYMKNKMVFVVKAGSDYKTLTDLEEKKIGVQSGSSAEQILSEDDISKTFDETIAYSENITAFMDLEIGQIDAVFVDEILANYYIVQNDKDYVVIEESLAEEEYAIGFRKQDTELNEKINEILKEMKADGTLGKISTKWFGKDVTIIEAE